MSYAEGLQMLQILKFELCEMQMKAASSTDDRHHSGALLNCAVLFHRASWTN